MPHKESAKKRLRQREKRTERNHSVQSALKTYIRKTLETVKAGDVGKAKAALNDAYVNLDKAAARGIIHDNAAARQKSRLARAVGAMAAAKKS